MIQTRADIEAGVTGRIIADLARCANREQPLSESTDRVRYDCVGSITAEATVRSFVLFAIRPTDRRTVRLQTLGSAAVGGGSGTAPETRIFRCGRRPRNHAPEAGDYFIALRMASRFSCCRMAVMAASPSSIITWSGVRPFIGADRLRPRIQAPALP